MKRMIIAITMLSLGVGAAAAQESCEAKAMDKNGKALVGAAKTSFIKKCTATACEGKAIGSDGRRLAGAAKTSFMKKCQAGT